MNTRQFVEGVARDVDTSWRALRGGEEIDRRQRALRSVLKFRARQGDGRAVEWLEQLGAADAAPD